MNRVIKFRAWDEVLNKMIVFDEFSLDAYYSQEGFVIMQYTGLNDTEGKEIYEGDILYCPLYEGQEITPRVVEWVTGQFVLKNLWNDIFFPLYIMHDGKNKIIGNIYENPELMDK